MAPIEIIIGRIGLEKLRKLEGRKGLGFIYYEREREPRSLPGLQERLAEILTSGDPGGAHQTENMQKWAKKKAFLTDKYGEGTIANLFPDDVGHCQITAFVNALARGGIVTVSDLIEQKGRLGNIRGVGRAGGGRRLEAAELIISHFENQ